MQNQVSCLRTSGGKIDLESFAIQNFGDLFAGAFQYSFCFPSKLMV